MIYLHKAISASSSSSEWLLTVHSCIAWDWWHTYQLLLRRVVKNSSPSLGARCYLHTTKEVTFQWNCIFMLRCLKQKVSHSLDAVSIVSQIRCCLEFTQITFYFNFFILQQRVWFKQTSSSLYLCLDMKTKKMFSVQLQVWMKLAYFLACN